MYHTIQYGHELTPLLRKGASTERHVVWTKRAFVAIVSAFLLLIIVRVFEDSQDSKVDAMVLNNDDIPDYAAIVRTLRECFGSGDLESLVNKLYAKDACQYFPEIGSTNLMKACGHDALIDIYQQIIDGFGSEMVIIFKTEDTRAGTLDSRHFHMDFCLSNEKVVEDNMNAAQFKLDPASVKKFQAQTCFHDVWAMKREDNTWKISQEFEAGFWYWDQSQGDLDVNAQAMSAVLAPAYQLYAQNKTDEMIQLYAQKAQLISGLESAENLAVYDDVATFYDSAPEKALKTDPVSVYGNDVAITHSCLASNSSQCFHDFMFFTKEKGTFQVARENLEIATENRPEMWKIYKPDRSNWN